MLAGEQALKEQNDVFIVLFLEPETSTLKWLFQLDDSKSLHGKWLEITKHPLNNGWKWSSRFLFSRNSKSKQGENLRPSKDCLQDLLNAPALEVPWSNLQSSTKMAGRRDVGP